ncbi:MAG: SOS response-associated peptidase [Haloferacaceae archaeon]
MCGRTSLFAARRDLEAQFDATVVADGGYRPRYNVAPGAPLEVVTNDAPDEIDRYRWGLVPSWADDPGEGMINARAETAGEKRAFRDAWESRPCLVLSSGFYEWRSRDGGPKRPYRIYRSDAPAFAMAGLWEVWEGDDREVPCVTILTTEPNDLLRPIHDRMPVVLPAGDEGTWLAADPADRAEMCRPYPDDDLDADEVSTRVNDPGNDDPSVIDPPAHEQSGLGDFGDG